MQLSQKAEDLIYNSWGKGTKASYYSAWKKWSSWCDRREIDPFSAPVAQVLEFLTYLFNEGFQYRTINVHRSAISSVLPNVNNQPKGQHHLVKMLMKGILRGNPPLPRYEDTWDIGIFVRFLISLPDNKDLSLKLLSNKLATLLAITAPKKISEIARIDKKFMRVTQQGITFYLPGLSKTQKDCKSREFFYAKCEENQKLCVTDCLTEYFERTKVFRNPAHSNDPLLRTIIRPHKGLTSNAVSIWIKYMMTLSGIDATKFKAHSARRASTSKAFRRGVSVDDAIKMADWTNFKFYAG